MTCGQLRLYLGATAGVGKTYATIAPRGRVASFRLERIATIVGIDGDPELDVGLILRRQPRVVLVDELGHRGSHDHARRESVDRILASGIDVISTFDIGDLASLHSTVTAITGVEPNVVRA